MDAPTDGDGDRWHVLWCIDAWHEIYDR